MVRAIPWKRFWCRREDTFSLGDRGFLADPDGAYGKELNPNLTTFDRLQAVSCLALLGEPGVGKSWAFRRDVDAYLRASARPQPVIRLNLRGYGSEDRLHRALFEDAIFRQWTVGKHELHLYLDSLDECLLRIDNIAALLADELSKYSLERLKLRIACRTASWPALLENAFVKGYGRDGFAAFELVPLRRADVAQAAELSGIVDANTFLTRVDELQIASFAIKPVTLGFLIDTYKQEGDLPNSVLDLYEKGCSILCEEQNESRRAARSGKLSPKDRVAVASRIAAATQFGNRYSVWTGTEAAGVPGEDVPVAELAGGIETGDTQVTVTHDALMETLDTGLFSSRGQERLGWAHQTYAEFLAARYCIQHQVPIQQLRFLVFHPRRKRVIPQLRDVASWTALQNPELFSDIAKFDPEVLLGSAAASLSQDQRKIAAAALLKCSENGHLLHFKYQLEPLLRNLAHVEMAAQLRPFLTNHTYSSSTRHLAVNIARECNVHEVGDALADLALSNDDEYHLRAAAAFAVAEMGSESDRLRLRPLLRPEESDQSEELKGASLRAIWPGDRYDDTIWSFLTPPRQTNFHGLYQSYLYHSIIPKLKVANLPAALRWCAAHRPAEFNSFASLQESILLLAMEHIFENGIADLLAVTLLERLKSGVSMQHGDSDAFQKILANDARRRRHLLEALFPLLSAETFILLLHPLVFLYSEDVVWLIDRVVNQKCPSSAKLEAKMIRRLASRFEPEAVTAVWHAAKQSSIIASECDGLFEPMPLDSEEARWGRKPIQKGGAVASALRPRIEQALRECEGGDVDGWLKLSREMSVNEGGTNYVDFGRMTIERLPGWLESDEPTRARIALTAKRYLSDSTFPQKVQFPSTQIQNGTFAGINALVLLRGVDPAFLHEQPAKFWERWIPCLIADSRTQQRDSVLLSVVQLAATAAPDPFCVALLKEVQFDSDVRQYFYVSSLVEAGWSKTLGNALLEKLKQNDLSNAIQRELLLKLIQCRLPAAKSWAEGLINSDYQNERGRWLAPALLEASEDAGWSVLWPLIQVDTKFGRALLESASYVQEKSFTNKLNDAQLADLYIWLLQQYPPDAELHIGASLLGPSDTIRFLRDGSLELLKKRSSFAACDGLTRAMLHFPQYAWLRHHFDEAELLACASTWQAPAPKEIITIAADGHKRLVESSAQLLDVILESLARLQAELHGELASVGSLWNSEDSKWWPKEEEDLSDFIALHLKKDLGARGIIINREVQIRRGRRGEMPGQNTDIHVDAINPKGAQGQLYGQLSVVIEVKGTWNKNLMLDMKEQLRDRYLKNSDCHTGLYLPVHFKAHAWRHDDWRRAQCNVIDIQELRTQLAVQASELSAGILIGSLVLDASLDSTDASAFSSE